MSEEMETENGIGSTRKPKSKVVAYLLWFFLGIVGAHVYYQGKILKGIIYTFTMGILGIGWIIDLFLLSGQIDVCNGVEPVKENRGGILNVFMKIISISRTLQGVNHAMGGGTGGSGASGVCYCKDCGASGTLNGLRHSPCKVSPTGRHRPYAKYYK
jgi:TM2 domain-containing membrane protein YozV